ncbi:MAG TPA: hypothetical protein GX510_08335 [Firmicutes bacterium]|nr:hypothetical protein [Candidatus Fermentithermobacillaceae bacterium]
MDYRREHIHNYRGRTSTEMGHYHTFADVTGAPVFTNENHVHDYATETSVTQDHSHRITGTSEMQTRAPLGHVHRIQGLTSYAHGHSHSYDVYTGRPRSPMRMRTLTGEKQGQEDEAQAPTDEKDEGRSGPPKATLRRLFRKSSSHGQEKGSGP